MSALTLSRKGLFPKLTSDLFDTGNFFSPHLLEFDKDLMDWGIANRIPSVNIMENPKDYKIELAAPGLDKNDFRITFDNGMLAISAEKKEEIKEEKDNFNRREFSYSQFTRSFRLPENCLPEQIVAKYENGLLRLMLPKKEVSVAKVAKEIKVL